MKQTYFKFALSKMNRQNFYHITQEEWADEVVLHPRSNGKYRPCAEPKTPRICVAPSIAQCLVALGNVLGENKHDDIHVYKAVSEHLPEPAEDIPDAEVTGESWFRKPTKFKHVHTIPADEFSEWEDLLDLAPGPEYEVPKQFDVLNDLEIELSDIQKEVDRIW